MANYKMTIEYDGGRYDGWQRSKDESTNTISCKITEVLQKMANQEVELFCGCRTETGVHAYSQIVNFKISTNLKPNEIQNYLNRYLPRDIAVTGLEQVDDRFHSQLNAKSKTYLYRIDANQIANVFERKYRYHSFHKLNLTAMRKGAQYFVGSHEYKNFSTVKKNKSTVKNVTMINIEEKGNEIQIRITADDFLHNMARLMIGILLDIGNEKRQPEDIVGIFEGRAELSPPADSCGLFLENIEYK